MAIGIEAAIAADAVGFERGMTSDGDEASFCSRTATVARYMAAKARGVAVRPATRQEYSGKWR